MAESIISVLPHEIIIEILLKETVLWNPAVKKSKKLPTLGAKLRNGCSYYLKYGFGYDETRDDYKVVVIQCIYEDSGSCDTVVNIYSLKSDSWRTINKFLGNFLVNSPGKFVDGKLYWALSADVDTFNMCNIISLDLADETWRRLELLDSYGKGCYPLALGVVGSHLSVLCLNCIGGNNSDVWIMKDCGVEVSWTKIFTVDHPKDLGEFVFFTSIFSVPCYKSNKDEILLLLPPIIMTYNGSTRQVEVIADQFEECAAFRDWIYQVSNMRIVVNIYSLRTDSWTTLHDQLHGIFIINHSADETWGCLELSVSGEDNSNIKLGVVGSAFCALFLPSRYYYF
ncbi:F-box/kelch-repeat protein At3g23880-like [Solanum verrucosum]|uniref:F-box/kelch-repeat protein At3g23880-like n=1 Tax=Solanum verrucosum TaxID=315347 RepID=UPI0020D1EE61|nr:F-box/kelch-repeat protein At3g23880-like [Solanum verrucosum]